MNVEQDDGMSEGQRIVFHRRGRRCHRSSRWIQFSVGVGVRCCRGTRVVKATENLEAQVLRSLLLRVSHVFFVRPLEVLDFAALECQMRVATSSMTSWSCVTSSTVPSYRCNAMFNALMDSRSRCWSGSSSTRNSASAASAGKKSAARTRRRKAPASASAHLRR